MRKAFLVLIISIFAVIKPAEAAPETDTTAQPPANKDAAQSVNRHIYVGEFFGVPVSVDNYFFIQGVITVFGNKFGPQPKTDEDLDNVIWDQLLLSYEAFRRGIAADPKEIEGEISKIVKADRVDFDWRTNKEAYEEWVKGKTGLSSQLFENYIKHLIELTKLRDQIMEGFDPQVSDKEAYDEFFKESNNLGVELIRFDELDEANKFYKKVKKNPGLWDKEKEKNPDEFKRPGNVSLEFLIDLWKFPKEGSYEMMKEKIGNIHPPEPIYKGYAVFKILAQRHSDRHRFDEEGVKESYLSQVKQHKRVEAYSKWFEDLKESAKIQKLDREDVLEIISELNKREAAAQEDTGTQE